MKSKATNRTKSDLRRREAERLRDEQRGRAWKIFLAQFRPVVILIWLGFFALTVAVMNWGSDSLRWSLNEKVDRDITARVSFTFEDQLRTEEARSAAEAAAPNVYIFRTETLQQLRSDLASLGTIARDEKADPPQLKLKAEAFGWVLDDEALSALNSLLDESSEKTFDGMVEDVLGRLRVQYLVDPPRDPNRRSTPSTAILRSDLGAPEVPAEELVYVTDRDGVRRVVRQIIPEVESVPASLHEVLARKLVRSFCGAEDSAEPVRNPLWRYDAEATEEEMQAAADRVEPITITRTEGSTLVQAGRELGHSELKLLAEEHAAFLEKERQDNTLRTRKYLSQLGVALVLLLVIGGLALYVAQFQPRVFHKPARTVGLCSLLLLMVAFSRLLERASGQWNAPSEFSVGFVVIAAALLTIAYNQRFALGACFALSMLAMLAVRGEFGLLLTMLVAMSITVFMLREVRTRSKLVVVGTVAAAGAFVASFATGVMEQQELKYIIVHAGSAGLATFLAGFIVQGTLYYFERAFGIATSMTLLEWCDASRPLLRRLAQEAPGTYSHSLVLSQMAEEASETIGANGLLARVGALYHDIGKIQKADYFVENQESRMNRHDRLSPTMSLLIIVGHVKDGMEMAKAYGLPRILHAFIAEHHGTTVVRYFHHVASEAAAKNVKGRHDREVSESEFRYPGPKPRSRETAILMVCDGCEGAVRALSEPTSTRIESTVHQVFMDRLRDGQFDQCDITLRELHLVEQSLVKSLCAIHHGRIKYPKSGGASKAKGEAGKGDAPRTPESAEAGKESSVPKDESRQTKDEGSKESSKSRKVAEVVHQN